MHPTRSAARDGRSAGFGIHLTLTNTSVALRTTSAVVAGAAAVIGAVPPVRTGWTYLAVGGLLLWSGVFWHAMRRGRSFALLAVADAAVVILLCFCYRWLVPPDVLTAGSGQGWIDLLASVAAFTSQLGLPQPAGVLVGAALVAAHAYGRSGFGEADVVLILQVFLAAAIRMLLQRSGRAADAALLEEGRQRTAERARTALRADERDHQRRLHDTVLATLTMVGSGTIGRDSDALRRRAAGDIAVLEAVRSESWDDGSPGEPAALGALLRQAAAAAVNLRVSVDLVPVQVPDEVATALADCVSEALTNVERHAGTTGVRVSARPERDGVIVTIGDDGVGFDPVKVSPARRGLRESVIGRVRAVGGNAHVDSAPGAGATIVLRWPDV